MLLINTGLYRLYTGNFWLFFVKNERLIYRYLLVDFERIGLYSQTYLYFQEQNLKPTNRSGSDETFFSKITSINITLSDWFSIEINSKRIFQLSGLSLRFLIFYISARESLVVIHQTIKSGTVRWSSPGHARTLTQTKNVQKFQYGMFTREKSCLQKR